MLMSEKLANLSQVTDSKLQRLKDKKVELGVVESIYDGDTYTMQGDTTSTRANGIDTFETTKSSDWFLNPKNVDRMEKQKAILSQQLGRPATNEDVFAAGDTQAQQAQQSFLPVIGEDGKPLPAIVQSQQQVNPNPLDKSPQNNYGRNIGSVQTLGGMQTLPDGTEIDNTNTIGNQMSMDNMPMTGMDYLRKQANVKGSTIPYDGDNRLQEDIDIAQSGMYQWWAESNKAVGKIARSVAKTFGVSGPQAKEWFPEDAKSGLFGEKFVDMAKTEFADSLAGVNPQTRADFEAANQEAIKSIKDSDYGEAAWNILTQLDRHLAVSAAETVSLATYPTGMLTLIGRTSKQAEEYEKNNGKEPSAAWIAGSLVSDALLLYGERLIIGKGIEDAVKGVGAVKAIGTSSGKEAIQEGLETTKETAFTQKGAFTEEADQTLEEIVTSPETQFGAMTGAASAGALSGTGQVLGKAKDVTIDKKDQLKEKLSTTRSKPQEEGLSEDITPKYEAESSKNVDEAVATDFKVMPTEEQAGYLKELDDIAIGLNSIGKKEDVAKVLDKKRELIAQWGLDIDEGKSLKLGSEEDAVEAMENALLYAKDIETGNKIAEKIAQDNNIGLKKLDDLKDSMEEVDIDATYGPSGYITQGRALKRAIANGDTKRQQAIEKQMGYFQNTQIEKLAAINKAIQETEERLAEGTLSEDKVEISWGKKGKAFIYFDGKGTNKSIKPQIYDIRNKTEANVKGIEKAYKEATEQEMSTPKLEQPNGEFTGEEKRRGKVVETAMSMYEGNEIDKEFYEANAKEIDEELETIKEVKGEKPQLAKKEMPKVSAENVGKYQVVPEIISKTGVEIVAKNVKGKVLISNNRKLWKEKYESKAWTKPRPLSDGSFSKPLPGDAFSTFNDFYQFVIAHEVAHDTIKIKEGESRGDYETRVNEEALKAIKIKKKETKSKITVSRAKEIKADLKAKQKETEDLDTVEKLQDRIDKIDTYLDVEATKGSIAEVTEATKEEAQREKANEKDVDASYIVTTNKKSILGNYGVQHLGEGVVEYANKAVTNIGKALGDLYAKNIKLVDILSDSPARSLIYDENTGNIRPNVATAIQLGIDEVIAFNSKVFGYKTKKDMARMLGIDESNLPNKKYKAFNEWGMNLAVLADDIGKSIASNMGIKVRKGVPEEDYKRIVSDLGFTALAVLNNSGVLDIHTVKAKDYNEAVDGEGGSDVVMVRFTEKYRDADNAFEVRNKLVDVVKARYSNIAEILEIDSSTRKEPSKKALPEVTKVVARNNKIAGVGDKVVKAINALQKIKFTKSSAIDFLSTDKDIILKHLGYVKDIPKEWSFTKKDSQKAKNDQILTSIKELENMEDGSVVFKWFYSKNGRYFMDSNTINPQSNTFHRFMVVPEAFTATIDSKNETHMKKFRYALAQAAGFSVDKKNEKAIQAEGQRLIDLGSVGMKEAMKTTVEYQKRIYVKDLRDNKDKVFLFGDNLIGKGKKGQAIIRDERNAYGIPTKKLPSTEESAYFTDSEYENNIKAINEAISKIPKGKTVVIPSDGLGTGLADLKNKAPKTYEYLNKKIKKLEFKVDHIGHYLQAIKAVEALEKSNNGKFNTDITAEYDALTSGFAIKLMQYPILGISGMKKWLKKVGVTTSGSITTMSDVLDSGLLDSYQELGSQLKVEDSPKGLTKGNTRLWNSMKDVLPRHIEGEKVSSELRSLFKPVFMTFNYAAGIASIKKALATSIVEDIINTVAPMSRKEIKESKYSTLFSTLESMIGKDIDLLDALRNKAPENIKVGRKDIKNVMEDVIVETYGEQVETILNNEFGKFVDANKTVNKAFEVMFAVFNKAYIEATKGKNLSEEDKLEVVKDLIEKFPIMRGPLDNAYKNGIAIFDVGSNESQGTIRPFYRDAQGNLQRVKVASIIKGMKAAISSGAVIPVHFVDAAPINEMARKGKQALFIHDAKMENILDSDKGVFEYNKEWYKANKDYSIVEALGEAYERVIKGEDLTGLGIKDVSDLTQELRDLVKEVKEGREWLFENVQQVGQMVGMEGSVYTINESLQEDNTGYNGKTKKEVKEWAETIKANPFLKDILKNIDLKDC